MQAKDAGIGAIHQKLPEQPTYTPPKEDKPVWRTDTGGAGGGKPKKQEASFHDVDQTNYNNALNKLNTLEANAPTYAGTYEADLQNIYGQILNRDKFRYDVNTDALYKQMRDNYVLQGQQAMMDTQGQAAALTGGYGSSFGQAAGQQAYNQSLQALNNVVPELYDRAYQRYNDEQDRLTQDFALAGQMRDSEYGQYRDASGDFRTDREYYGNRADTEYAKLMTEAENLAKYGDFSGYAALYGEDAAKNMFDIIYNNRDLARRLGLSN